MNRSFIILLTTLIPFLGAYSNDIHLVKREEAIQVRTSIIVPCTHAHFRFVPELLEHFCKQTILPDEVVISLSNAQCVQDSFIQKIELGPWPFNVIVMRNFEPKSAGENRNIACKYSSGDLLICQDADDAPHPQRVEIVKFLFENYYVDHLLHTLVKSEADCPPYSVDEIIAVYYKGGWSHFGKFQIANGPSCISREVSNVLKWPDSSYAEDIEFNSNAAHIFKSVVVQNPLYVYRQNYNGK